MKFFLFIFLFLVSFSYSSTETRGLLNEDSKLKKKPNIFSKSFDSQLSYMDTVIILGDSTDKYYQVKHNKKIGYLRKDLVRKIVDDKPFVAIAPEIKKATKKTKPIKVKKTPKKEKNDNDKVRLTILENAIEEKSKLLKKNDDLKNKITENEKYSSKIKNYLLTFVVISIGLGYLSISFIIKFKKIEKRFKPVVDVDKEVSKVKKDYKHLQKKYKKGKSTYDNIKNEIDKLSDDLDMMANGLYEPKFNFDTSDQYKQNIKSIRDKQKLMIRTKQAIPPFTNWTIDGSKREGTKFVNRQIRIALRAFNGECDSIISKVRWNNYDRMVERIEKSATAIDSLLETSNMSISYEFIRLKISELYAVHEYLEKKHDEMEEMRMIRAEEREEKKVLMEAEKARKEAEREEKIYNEALEKARKQLGLLSGSELAEKENQIKSLESQLNEALEKKERAKSMAQLTKSGHVYIISNIGSFGEDIYKIGLTRRLDPSIRVRELGDASVPFAFDIHAMIFSEDAPALEKRLHEKFNEYRVNLVNRRKEYFKLELEQIKQAVLELDKDADFVSTTESRDYKETKLIIAKKQNELDKLKEENEKFPDEI